MGSKLTTMDLYEVVEGMEARYREKFLVSAVKLAEDINTINEVQTYLKEVVESITVANLQIMEEPRVVRLSDKVVKIHFCSNRRFTYSLEKEFNNDIQIFKKTVAIIKSQIGDKYPANLDFRQYEDKGSGVWGYIFEIDDKSQGSYMVTEY